MAKTYQEALATVQSYLESDSVMKETSSISVSFSANWTGEREDYVIDTLTYDIDLRVFSLETAHVVAIGKKLPQDSNEHVELLKRLKKEFKQASKKLRED